MCGFAGFVGKVEDRETVLVNMMDTIIHRGPDSAGTVSYTHLDVYKRQDFACGKD